MASSSSSCLPRTWRYRVFTSFHGPDVRKTLLSHLRKQFSFNGISMFDDQGIERSQTIAPALTQAIRESRISIVVLSEKYASSSWCLDELVEIFRCKENLGQIVMTVFYGVDPSDVRKQTGNFGSVFNETCARKTDEERRRWSLALTDAGNIAGEDFLNWDNEANMIEKIAKDVLDKLNVTTLSKDFDGLVGLEAHLREIESLLDVESDGVKMVAIFGPAGIGKTTIARALHSRLSTSFQNTCFMKNLKGSYRRGLDEYGLKLRLQKKLLSKILNRKDMKIEHLRAIPEMLYDRKVLIILDDVNDMKQLEALVNKTTWFGPGSRILITTEDQELLEKHGIKNTYHVDFPTKEEASKILCRYAFGESFAPGRFEKLVERVSKISSDLPLGLRVIGSTLQGKSEDDWEDILSRLEHSLHGDIEGVLGVGYDNLHKDDQLLFLLIAFFFSEKDIDYVKTILADSNLNVRLGLKNLAYRSLIQISLERKIVMHKLLQQVGREAVQRQDQRTRQILIDNDEICDVLENASSSRNVMGISLDISTLSRDVYISSEAFKKISNLRFFNIYKTRRDTNVRVHVPEDMNFPSTLRLLKWEKYPGKWLSPTFNLEFLVELNLEDNELEKLWEGVQPLKNLKKMSLERSKNLKELPNVSNASNLERLILGYCYQLVDIPSSIGNLQKLETLDMQFCVNLQAVPTHINLASLESVNMLGCSQLRKFPHILTNVTKLAITDTMLQDLPESFRLSSCLQSLYIFSDRIESLNLLANDQIVIKDSWEKRAQYLKDVDVDIEELPDWIKDLHGLEHLGISGCPKLASLPELPASLRILMVMNCESLETVMPFPSECAIGDIKFYNCLKLGQEARRVITQQSTKAWLWLPGRNVPAEFEHRAIGNSLTIPSGTKEFLFCVVVSPKQKMKEYVDLFWRLGENGVLGKETIFLTGFSKIETEHLHTRRVILRDELVTDALLEFSTTSKDLDVIECGFLTDKTNIRLKGKDRPLWHQDIIMDETSSNYKSVSEQVYGNDDESLSEFDEPRVKRLKTL